MGKISITVALHNLLRLAKWVSQW